MNPLRPMRLGERALSDDEARNILSNGEYGVLALSGKDGCPYGVPVNYAYRDGVIYIHHTTALSLLSDDLLFNNRVSFTVVSRSKIIPEKFTDAYESAIAFGTASFTDDVRKGLTYIAEKYCPAQRKEAAERIDRALGKVLIIEIKVERVTGKHRPEDRRPRSRWSRPIAVKYRTRRQSRGPSCARTNYTRLPASYCRKRGHCLN